MRKARSSGLCPSEFHKIAIELMPAALRGEALRTLIRPSMTLRYRVKISIFARISPGPIV